MRHSTNNFGKIVSIAAVFVWSHNPYPLVPSSPCGGVLHDQTKAAALETNRKRNLRDNVQDCTCPLLLKGKLEED